MSHKATHLLLLSTLFLFLVAAITPPGNTVTWSDETRLTTHSGWDTKPSILQTNDSRIWIAWQSRRTGNFDLFCRIYNWSSWSDPMPLTTHPNQDITASLMQTNDGTIWLFWASNRTGNYDLFYKTSSDNGVTWSNATQITEDSRPDVGPSVIQVANGTIWVVWASGRTSNYDLFYKTSSDNGVTWSNATRLTTNVLNDDSSSIIQTKDGTIWVVWEYIKPGRIDIYCKTSSDGGASWSDDIQLSELDSHKYMDIAPSITQMRDGTIWLFYSSDRILYWDPDEGAWLPQYELFYKTSVDNGVTWSEDIQFTNSTWDDDSASVAQISDKTIWITWKSNKDDNFDIYFKISSEIIFRDVAITSVTPDSTMVNQSETVSISVTAENRGDENETFTVDCYAAGSPIVKVEVGLEAYTDQDENLNITCSWDGGTTWAPAYGPIVLPVSDPGTVSWVDFTGATNWTGLKLSDANFRTKAKSVKIGPDKMGNVFLDWIPVRVTYAWGAVISTNSPSSTSAVIIIYPPSAGWNNPAYAYSSNDTYAYSSTISAEQQYGNYGFNIPETILIGSENVTLSSGNSTTTVFSWDTTGCFPATYTIIANASAVPSEYPVNLDDNTLIDETVTVLVHDVAITNITLSSASVYQGNPLNIYVEVKNKGNSDETFDVSAYYNLSLIDTILNVSLAAKDNINLTFTWNTAGIPYGNYEISAEASVVPAENDTADNTYINGPVHVGIPGDTDGDGKVDKYDFGIFANAFGSRIGKPKYNPYADLDQDGDVDKYDFGTFAENYGKHE